MSARSWFLSGVLAVPVIFFVGAATSHPAWELNSPVGQAMPFLLFVAGGCCLLAPFRTSVTGGRRALLALGAVVVFVGVVFACAFLSMLIWGSGIR